MPVWLVVKTGAERVGDSLSKAEQSGTTLEAGLRFEDINILFQTFLSANNQSNLTMPQSSV